VPKKIKKTKCRGSVLKISILEKEIVLFDNAYNIYFFDRTTLAHQKSIVAIKDKPSWHKYAKAMDCSKNGFAALSINKSTKSLILKLDEKIQKRAILDWHKSESGVLSFSPNSSILASGGEDGRCLLFDGVSFNLIGSLFPKPDYISSITFSENSKIIAVSSFDKRCEIFDIERSHSIANFETSDVIEDMFFNDENSYLFFSCKNGNCGRYDIEDKKRFERNIEHQWFTKALKLNKGEYALIGGKDQKLSVIECKTITKLFDFPFEESGLSSITIDGDRLLVGFINGIFEVYKFDEGSEELLLKLKTDKIYEAYELTQQNLFLKLQPEYIEAKNRLWEAAKKDAIYLMAKQKTDEALKRVMPFLEDGAKKEEFEFYLSQIEDMEKFIEAVEQKKYAEALGIADKNEKIKSLNIYDKLDAFWKKLFDTAKVLLQKNAILNQSKARELLEPYMSVKSKKDQILSLLNNADKYTQAEEMLKERDFAGFFRACDRFPFLKESVSYQKAIMLGEQIIDKAFAFDQSGDYEKALSYLAILTDFTPFKISALERKKHIENKIAFFSAIKQKQTKIAYEIIERDNDLTTLPEFESLKNEFNTISKKAYKKAFGGFSDHVLQILGDYLDIIYWQDKIGAIVKVSYLNEIKYGAQKYSPKQVDWKRTFEDYVSRFGKDDEIQKTAKLAGLYEFLTKVKGNGDNEGYKKIEFLHSIIAKSGEA